MNYREVKRKNRTKTKIVLVAYLLIYLVIGLLLDVAFIGFRQGGLEISSMGLIYSLKQFLTFELIPIGSFILLGLGFITFWFSVNYPTLKGEASCFHEV